MNDEKDRNDEMANGAIAGEPSKSGEAVSPPQAVPLWRKLIPFALRARVVLVGRERIMQYRKRLAFLLITEDISENSRNEALRIFPCPIYQLLTMEGVEEVFGYKGTKVLGFRRSPLSRSIAEALKEFRVPSSLANGDDGGKNLAEDEQ